MGNGAKRNMAVATRNQKVQAVMVAPDSRALTPSLSKMVPSETKVNNQLCSIFIGGEGSIEYKQCKGIQSRNAHWWNSVYPYWDRSEFSPWRYLHWIVELGLILSTQTCAYLP